MKITVFDILAIAFGILFLKSFYGFLTYEWKAKKKEEQERRKQPRVPSDYFTKRES